MTSPNTQTSPIRVGFIGLSAAGWAANSHGFTLLDPKVQAKFKLVAVGTSNPTSAAASAETYSNKLGWEVRGYGASDVEQLVSLDDVDLVAISVKSSDHLEVTKKVIAAGKPFFLEWPAGRNVAETEGLARLARERSVKSLVGLQGRQSNIFKKIKNVIASGKIGKIHAVNVNLLFPRELQAWAPVTSYHYRHITNVENGTAVVVTAMGHFLDTLIDTVGPLAKVSARGTKLFPLTTILGPDGQPLEQVPSALPDHFTINGILKDSGAWVSLTVRLWLPLTPGRRQFTVDIDGDEGSVHVETNNFMISGQDPDVVLLNGEDLVLEEGDGPKFTVVGDFLKSALFAYAKGKEGGGVFADIEDALRHRKLVAAIQDSLLTDGVWVDL
ncbi:NAD(P)-binding protein [Coprinopsis marcescibilis]|uniref:NAD(P)-binding protein n=1 Tax=Coprinopsis marcescibilis TaxID=230819 RepID=A0A5C3KMH0_COPMA|nr:NAD(P)-binding protein [Coprinopsis marcescibilis]